MVTGLVVRPGVVGRRVLRSLGGDQSGGAETRTVTLPDFFSSVGLHTGAELIMWNGADGSRTVTPIAHLLDDATSVLLLGGSDRAWRPRWSEPVVLRCMSLPDPDGIEIVAATALTFAEFVGAVR